VTRLQTGLTGLDSQHCLCSDASNVRSSVSLVTRLQTGLTGLDSQQDPGLGSGIPFLATENKSILGNQIPT